MRKLNTICKVCDKPIYRSPAAILKGNVYCSKTCYGKDRSKFVECKICKNLIHASRHAQTCSRACANKARTGIKYKQTGAPLKDKVKDNRSIRSRLIKKFGEICVSCGVGPFYNGKNLTLQIDHIDGNRLNNLEDNLRFLCPNCHSQTDTFGAKNIGRFKKV